MEIGALDKQSHDLIWPDPARVVLVLTARYIKYENHSVKWI